MIKFWLKFIFGIQQIFCVNLVFTFFQNSSNPHTNPKGINIIKTMKAYKNLVTHWKTFEELFVHDNGY